MIRETNIGCWVVLALAATSCGKSQDRQRSKSSALGGSPYALRTSSAPDRKSATLLDGASLSGDAYVFTSDGSGDAWLSAVSSVAYYLDDPGASGSPFHVQGQGPVFDFAGSSDSGGANPWDTSTVASGAHFITELVTTSSGAAFADTANFTVNGESGGGGSATSFIGCFADQATRDLPAQASLSPVTVESCISACAQLGHAYAGVQYASQCFCGDAYGSYGPSTSCDMACDGDASETCGGSWANDVYATGVTNTCVPQCNGAACGDDGCQGSCGACPTGQTCSNGQCVISNDGWTLVWDDEFDGSSLDTSKWSIVEKPGALVYYTPRSENVSVSNGALNLVALNDNYTDASGATHPYTSGYIWTKGLATWSAGAFEIRARLSPGQGMHPTFWFLNDTDTFSLMECEAGTIDSVYANEDGNGAWYTLPSGDFSDGFHVFRLEWSGSTYNNYVDGVLYSTETHAPTGAYWLILNLAAVTYTGGITSDTPFPNTLTVDYVRIYQQ